MWRFYWEIKPILMSWLLKSVALTGWPSPFNGKPTDTLFLSLKWLLISSSPASSPFRPVQFAILEHSKRDITAFTHLQKSWPLLWYQFRGFVWKHQSKGLRWALPSWTDRDPRSSWSRSTEENFATDGRIQGERPPMAAGVGRCVSAPAAACVYWISGHWGRCCSTEAVKARCWQPAAAAPTSWFRGSEQHGF